MASGGFLLVREHANKNSDTFSEISESGTTNSEWPSNWDSKEELKDLLTKLGLKELSDLHQERFRVDRKKLEHLLTGNNDGLIPADVFFSKIMEDTDTYITWPNKLKIGAKSKKDPHVRIAGRPEDVKAAKERIITLLETKCNRITMKMDVSYTDHSHIIGKGGVTIKRVMQETHCHVHFPDSNRSNPLEKSNQVSISGDIEGVENARSRVRELIPLIFGFELPIMTQNVDTTSTYLLRIQEQYNVQVMFKTRPKLHATLVLVKGLEWEASQVKQATILLKEYMCDNLANQIPVQVFMEISPHHHSTVLGKNHANLKQIMEYTNCKIIFPDAQDPNIPNLKKSNVNISGNIDDVYKARQLLMGSLPLIIIFDLPEDNSTLRTRQDQMTEIQTTYDVTITMRQKARQNTWSCVIKGVEKNAGNIYKARNCILGIDETCIEADIPQSYHFQTNLPSVQQIETSVLPQNPGNVSGQSPRNNWINNPTSNLQAGPPFVGMVQQPQFLFNVTQTHSQQSMSSSGYQSLNQTSGFGQNPPAVESKCEETYSTISSNNSPNSRGSDGEQRNDYSFLNMTFPPGYHDGKRQLLSPHDFENKKLAGFRAMQAKPSGGPRQPINSWSGYYVSHTSPTPFTDVMWQKVKDLWQEDSHSPATPSLNTSNLLDHTPVHVVNGVVSSDWNDLPSLLTSLGLSRYINVFNEHEVDLMVFGTLTDKDLTDIGVNAFGARRKMMLAISELNKRMKPFMKAPGAERKKST